MPASTDPILGLSYGWAVSDNFKAGMDANLRKLAAVVQASVADKDLATPPGSPANGDRYIVAASPTGSWVGHAGKIAVYETSAWVFYTPAEGWRVHVNDEDVYYRYDGSAWALERKRAVNNQTGTTYTLVVGDVGKVLELDNAAAITLTIPTNASAAIPVEVPIEIRQHGAGQVTVTPAGGVTLRSSGGKTKTAAQYAVAYLVKRATDEWYLSGDIAV